MIRAFSRLMVPLLMFAGTAFCQSSSNPPSAAHPDSTTSQSSESSKSQSAQSPKANPVVAPGDSTEIEVISTHKADYPIAAGKEGLQGEVIVKVFISESGDVERADVLSGDPILAEAAVKAAKKWKFKPFIRGGKPVKVATRIPFDFAFSDKVKDTAPPPDVANMTDTALAKVSPGVSLGLLIHKVAPVYPESARHDRIEGTVILRAQIGEDGRIKNLTPISGPKELIHAAVGAVQQWRYKPYLLKGQPVSVETEIRVNFQLSPR